ncbi:MAG: dihydropteroate synthase [Pseudomonadota bacterium]
MIDFSKAPLLMGVINVTPDSFSDGGDFFDPQKAIDHALQLVEEGADILDIGGESTRPGALPVTPEEEQRRVLPVLEGIKQSGCKTPVSIDTRHAETMQKSIDSDADIINDISALTHDTESLSVVSKAQIPVMLMHMQGTPETMQDKPQYDDVTQEVMAFLKERIEVCVKAGLDQNEIIIDPGIGFGKSLKNNLTLLNNLDKFHDLGCSVLLGASRKSFIEKICPDTPATERLPGSLAALLKGFDQGVQIFRVHDVKESKQALDVWQSISSA